MNTIGKFRAGWKVEGYKKVVEKADKVYPKLQKATEDRRVYTNPGNAGRISRRHARKVGIAAGTGSAVGSTAGIVAKSRKKKGGRKNG